jgi:PQQ-dependent catabolism-associated CXXCW motif protein
LRLARFAALLILPILLGAGVAEPEGFRMDDYNAPVPDALTGARVVDASGLAAAMAAGAVAIDVLPSPRRPPLQRADQPWLPMPHMNVFGSLWWPEVGRGAISPALDRWFRDRLNAVTGGDRDRPIAFYCKPACWMSWNAARRAVGYGFRHVLWFPGGIEAWSVAGYKLQPGTPEIVPLDQ